MSTFVEENELKAFMSEIELSDVVAVFHKGFENLTQFFSEQGRSDNDSS